MGIVDISDFTNVASEIGESVTIYNQTEAINTDYGSLTTQTLGTGTSETAIIEPINEKKIQMSEGRLSAGDMAAMFKSTSVITRNSIIEYGTKRFKIIDLIDIRVTGATHHYEANLKFLEDTSE